MPASSSPPRTIPIQWNGMKFLNRHCVAPPPADGRSRSIDLYHKGTTSYVRVQRLQRPARNTETHALHVKRVLDYVDVHGISTKRFKVVLDSRQRRRLRLDGHAALQARLPDRPPERRRPTASSPTSPNRPPRISPASPPRSNARRPPSASPRTPTPIASPSSMRTAPTSARNTRSPWPPS